MAFDYLSGKVFWRGVAVLSFVLLCLFILNAGWSRIQGSKDAATGDNDHRRLSFAGGDGRGADNRQSLIEVIISSVNTEAAAIVQQLVARKAASRDPQLIDVVRRMMNPAPTKGPIVLAARGLPETAQSKEVDALLNKQRNGFFIECGAYDGETSSNSLPLEYSRGWTGLLIEANPFYYVQMLGKNRKVWTLNACLSPYDYATQLQFETNFDGQLARVKLDDGLKNLSSSGDSNRKGLEVVPCFPLETILLALNRTHVDYFSLDIEGVELEVLKTIPFDRIDIHVLTVEYTHGRSGKQGYKSFMESKGFRTVKDVSGPLTPHANDYLFIKQ